MNWEELTIGQVSVMLLDEPRYRWHWEKLASLLRPSNGTGKLYPMYPMTYAITYVAVWHALSAKTDPKTINLNHLEEQYHLKDLLWDSLRPNNQYAFPQYLSRAFDKNAESAESALEYIKNDDGLKSLKAETTLKELLDQLGQQNGQNLNFIKKLEELLKEWLQSIPESDLPAELYKKLSCDSSASEKGRDKELILLRDNTEVPEERKLLCRDIQKQIDASNCALVDLLEVPGQENMQKQLKFFRYWNKGTYAVGNYVGLLEYHGKDGTVEQVVIDARGPSPDDENTAMRDQQGSFLLRAMLETCLDNPPHFSGSNAETLRTIARAFLIRQGDEVRTVDTNSTPFVTGAFLDLSQLWERYLLKKVLPSVEKCHYQQSIPIMNKNMRIIPDFLWEDVVLDAKYKFKWGNTMKLKRSNQNWTRFIHNDVYQILAYMLALNCAKGGVVFPVDEKSFLKKCGISSMQDLKSDKLQIPVEKQGGFTFWRFPFAVPSEGSDYSTFRRAMDREAHRLNRQIAKQLFNANHT